MNTGNRTFNGWMLLLVMLLQVTGGAAVVFLFDWIFKMPDARTTGSWLLMLVGAWLGFSGGIHLVGETACMLSKRIDPQRCGWRLLVTALAAFVPLACLLVPGLRNSPENRDLFDEMITRKWQPILEGVSLVSGATAYQVGAWWCRKRL
jgi:hypothetical protein